MSSRMTFNKALGIGLTVAFMTTFVAVIVAFIGQLELSVPGVIEISSTQSGAPSTAFYFNPLAPLLLALLVAVVTWGVARLRTRRQRDVERERHLAA
jgi:hypothetical protein